MNADDRTLGDRLVTRERGLDRAGGEAVAGDVEHIVGAAHDVDVAVLVDVAAVTGEVIARVGRHVGRHEPLVVVVERREGAGGQRQLDADCALLAGGQLLAHRIEDLDLVAGHAHRRRTGLDRQGLQAAAVGGDRPAGLGLPPVVDDGDAELFVGPVVGVGVQTLPGEVEGLEVRQVVALDLRAFRVLPLDRANGRRGREHRHRAVFRHDPPEGARIGGADRLAFVDDRRRAGEQRGVDDVGVADDPAHVAGGEHRLAWLDAVDIAHRPPQCDRVTAVVAVDALGLSGGAGGVEDVERVGRCHLDAVGAGLGGR